MNTSLNMEITRRIKMIAFEKGYRYAGFIELGTRRFTYDIESKIHASRLESEIELNRDITTAELSRHFVIAVRDEHEREVDLDERSYYYLFLCFATMVIGMQKLTGQTVLEQEMRTVLSTVPPVFQPTT